MISSTHTLIAKAALILLVTGFSAGCSSALRYDNETQRQLVEHAQVIERINQPAAEIWPGFWSARPSYILYQRQGPALVVSDTTPEGDYQQLTPRFYYFPNGLPRLSDSFHIDYQLGELQATAASLQATPRATVSLLFHEAFHGYQREHFSRGQASEFVEASVFQDPQIRALLELRRLLLAQALDATPEQVIQPLEDLLIIDQVLLLQMGVDAVKRLHQLELIEGSADYVGAQAEMLTQTRGGALDAAQRLTNHAIKDRLRSLPNGVHHTTELRRYSYGTGAALVAIANRLARAADTLATNTLATNNPATLIQQSPSLQALYEGWLDFSEPNDETINSLLSRHPFDELVQWAYQQSSPSQALNLEQFAALTPATLDFAIHLKSKQATSALDVNFSTGNGGFTQPAENSYVLPAPQSVSVYAHMTSLLVEGAATHLQSPGEEPILRLQVKVDELPPLCGEQPSCQIEGLEFSWHGVEFSHQALASIRREENHLHIDVTEL